MPAENSRRRLAVFLFLSFSVLYLLTLTRRYSYDGLCYALDVEFGPMTNRFHPNHLLYSVGSWIFFRLARALGYRSRAIFLMQSANAVVGAATVAFFFLLVQRRCGVLRGLLAAAFLGLGNAFWAQVTDPGCYAWVTLGACLTLALLLDTRQWRGFRLGLAHGGLMLLHQMLSLTIFSFLYKLWREEQTSWSQRLSRLAAYGAGVLVAAVGPYAAVAAYFHNGSLHEALFWALGPAGPPPDVKVLSGYWWNLNLRQDIPIAWASLIRSMVAAGTMNRFFFCGIAVLVGVWLLYWTAEQRQRHADGLIDIEAIWIWIIVLNIFQSIFWIGAVHYRLVFLPPLIYLAAVASKEWRSRMASGLMGVLVFGMTLAIAVLNFKNAVHPRLSWDRNLTRTLWVSRQLGSEDFFLFAGLGDASIVNVYMAYFAPGIHAHSVEGYLFSHPDGDWSELFKLLRSVEKTGGRIFVEQTLFDPSTQRLLESSAGLPARTLAREFSILNVDEVLRGPFDYRLARVRIIKKDEFTILR